MDRTQGGEDCLNLRPFFILLTYFRATLFLGWTVLRFKPF